MARNQEGKSERSEPDLIEKLVSVKRVAKVVKGGRRFSFSAMVVVGDGKGKVGYGHGKAREVPEAITKATHQARSSMFRVPLKENRTIHHDALAQAGAGRVVLRAAPSGTGVIAGGPMRAVFEAVGVLDVVAKSLGSSNPGNMVRATFEAFRMMASPRTIAARRGKKISDLTGRRSGNQADRVEGADHE